MGGDYVLVVKFSEGDIVLDVKFIGGIMSTYTKMSRGGEGFCPYPFFYRNAIPECQTFLIQIRPKFMGPTQHCRNNTINNKEIR